MKLPYILLICCLCSAAAWAQDLAIVNASVYASPDATVVDHATVLIRAGKIAAVGRDVALPDNIRRLDVHGGVVCAGFWNTHVHFMEPKWSPAGQLPAATLARQLQDMLTRSGFTTVVDTGSDVTNTVALRRRIESGEVPGPRIYTAGIPLYPSHALPYYLNDLAAELRNQLHQPATPAEAAAAVRENSVAGADLTKLFTGSIVAPDHVVPMAVPVASAAVAEARRRGQVVFSHTTNLEGTNVAVASGVDVLAHAPELVKGIDDNYLRRLVARPVSMIPTLQLFSGDNDIADVRRVVFRFKRLGGVLMFGTDTGFLTDYDISEEYRQLALAGLGFREVLTMLTTAPAGRFGIGSRVGRIAAGCDADLTILGTDPASGQPLAFHDVKYTIRAGRVIFRREDRSASH
jgi:imidazolonepropionase-like amidohydrolase